MMSSRRCRSCRRDVQPVDGLCPLCGTALPKVEEPPADLPAPVDTDPSAVIPAEILDEDTDPGAAPIPEEDEGEYEEPETSGDESVSEQPAGPAEEQAKEPESSSEGTQGEADSSRTPKAEDEDKPLPRLPWGKAIAVLVYLLVGGGFMFYELVSSESAIIDRHLRSAEEILGEHKGSVDNDELIQAADHYLEALVLDMQLELAHRRLYEINSQLEQRRTSLPREMAHRYNAIASRAQLEKAQSRKGFWSELPLTPGERFGLHEHGRRMRRNAWFFFGGLALLVGWMLLSGSRRRLQSREVRGPNQPLDPDESYLP